LYGARGGVVEGLRDGAAERRRAVHAVDFVDVGPVEDVEHIHGEINPPALAQLEIAGEAQIPRIERVAQVCISAHGSGATCRTGAGAGYRRAADAFGGSTGHVAEGVETGEQREGASRLRGDNA